jgi:hypothetical protein
MNLSKSKSNSFKRKPLWLRNQIIRFTTMSRHQRRSHLRALIVGNQMSANLPYLKEILKIIETDKMYF